MASTMNETGPESEEDIVARHKKEKKQLQGEIQKLKHTVPKGDKKKKKEVAEEIAKLEADLEKRHQEELSQTQCEQGNNGITEESQNETVETEVPEQTAELSENSGRKSKAQKRREKKQAQGRDREERIKEQELVNRQGPRQQEMNKLMALLKQRGLALYEIPADGNCLYSAVHHQLANRSIESSSEDLRQKTAEFMRSHRDDFLPFLTHPDTGDMLSEEEFEKYCDKTANSPMWGGQLELRALSEVLRVPIEVLQADTQPLIIGESMQGNPLKLVYHRHVFRLGEHYNSVVDAAKDADGDENSSEANCLK